MRLHRRLLLLWPSLLFGASAFRHRSVKASAPPLATSHEEEASARGLSVREAEPEAASVASLSPRPRPSSSTREEEEKEGEDEALPLLEEAPLQEVTWPRPSSSTLEEEKEGEEEALPLLEEVPSQEVLLSDSSSSTASEWCVPVGEKAIRTGCNHGCQCLYYQRCYPHFVSGNASVDPFDYIQNVGLCGAHVAWMTAGAIGLFFGVLLVTLALRFCLIVMDEEACRSMVKAVPAADKPKVSLPPRISNAYSVAAEDVGYSSPVPAPASSAEAPRYVLRKWPP